MNSHLKVEQYGLERVPKIQQKTKWYEYAIMQGSFMVNTGNFLLPAFAVLHGGLSVFSAILATAFGAFFAYLFAAALSIPGARYGIPAQYAIRFIFGVRGTQWVSSPIRVIVALYWFGVQTIGVAIVLNEVLLIYFNLDISFILLAILLGIITAILALIGFNAIKKTLKQLFPLVLIGQAVILILLIKEIPSSGNSVTPLFFHHEDSISTMLFYGSLSFIQYVVTIASSSDLTRYSKSPKHGFYGLFTGSVFGYLIASTMGAISASFYQDINPFVKSIQLTDSKVLILIILFTATCAMLSINLNNVYAGAFCLLNSIPRLGRVNATIIFGIAAITLCLFPELVNEAEDYISLLGLLTIPIYAVIIVDYLWIKKGRLTSLEDPLVKPTEFHYNKIGLILVAIGAVFYYVIPEKYSPGFLTFLFVAITYRILKTIKWSSFRKNS